MYLLRWRKGGGCTNACICIGTHSQPFLQNRSMDIYETEWGWSAHGPLQVLLFFGQVRPGADPRWGKNRSRGVPFFNELLPQTGRLQQQTEWIAMIYKHVGWSVVIFGSIPKSNIWRVFDIFLPYFYAISIDFYAVKCLINIYSVLFPCLKVEECLYKRFKCFKNFNKFSKYLFRWRKGGCTNVYICMGTHCQPLLQNCLMDVYEIW